ncbi:MAG: hypothetical protein ACI31F_02645 [Muribaculaceae bacterium]
MKKSINKVLNEVIDNQSNKEYKIKEAVKSIIKTDINNFENYFWTECSGVIEILYSKYNEI